jgi:hypothetical protein
MVNKFQGLKLLSTALLVIIIAGCSGSGEPTQTGGPSISSVAPLATPTTPSANPNLGTSVGIAPVSSPESSAKLDTDLAAWVGTNYPTPALYTFSGSTTALSLNIWADPGALTQNETAAVYSDYQGVMLGYETINNHLIAYFGQADTKHNFYYFPVNLGDLTNPLVILVVTPGITSALSKGNPVLYQYPQSLYYLNENLGAADIFMLDSEPHSMSGVVEPNLQKLYTEINNQAAMTHQFNRFSSYAGFTGDYHTSPDYPQFKGLLNQRVSATKPNFSQIPYLNSLETSALN